MIKFCSISLTVLTFCVLTLATKTPHPRKVLGIMFNGLRWDYVSRTPNTTFFDYIAETGVKPERLIPVFPTGNFANIFSMITGTYPESHGIVSNNIYDPTTGTSLLNKFSDTWNWVERKTFYDILAENNINAKTFSLDVNDMDTVKSTVNNMVLKLTNDEAYVAVAYSDEPDFASHFIGAEPDKLKIMIQICDYVVGVALHTLQSHGLLDEVDVIIVGGHGMTNISPQNGINVTSCVNNPDDILVVDQNVHVLSGDSKVIHEQLKTCHPNMTVYAKPEIPDWLHYCNNSRIGDFVLIYNSGYYDGNSINHRVGYFIPGYPVVADHVYTPSEPDMHGAFFGRGPSFRCNYASEMISSVDIFPLTLRLLDLNVPLNDGQLSVADDLLKKSKTTVHHHAEEICPYVELPTL